VRTHTHELAADHGDRPAVRDLGVRVDDVIVVDVDGRVLASDLDGDVDPLYVTFNALETPFVTPPPAVEPTMVSFQRPGVIGTVMVNEPSAPVLASTGAGAVDGEAPAPVADELDSAAAAASASPARAWNRQPADPRDTNRESDRRNEKGRARHDNVSARNGSSVGRGLESHLGHDRGRRRRRHDHH